jgi:hypothetical protein
MYTAAETRNIVSVFYAEDGGRTLHRNVDNCVSLHGVAPQKTWVANASYFFFPTPIASRLVSSVTEYFRISASALSKFRDCAGVCSVACEWRQGASARRNADAIHTDPEVYGYTITFVIT